MSIYLLLIPAISSALLAHHVGRFHQLADLRQHTGAMVVAFAVLTPPLVAGMVLNTLAIIQIFKAAE